MQLFVLLCALVFLLYNIAAKAFTTKSNHNARSLFQLLLKEKSRAHKGKKRIRMATSRSRHGYLAAPKARVPPSESFGGTKNQPDLETGGRNRFQYLWMAKKMTAASRDASAAAAAAAVPP